MHSMHCARNITLCKVCKEGIPKSQFEDHQKTCFKRRVEVRPPPPPTNLERSNYFQERKAVEDRKIEARKERYVQKYDRLVDTGYSLQDSSYRTARPNSIDRPMGTYGYTKSPSSSYLDSSSIRQNGTLSSAKIDVNREETTPKVTPTVAAPEPVKKPEAKPSGLLACKYCDLELPKLELEDHENYCGSRTDKCLECGELVMYKYKQIHMDSNHGFLKLKDEPGPRASWDSTTQRSASTNSIETSIRRRPQPLRSFADFDYDPMPYLPSSYSIPGGGTKKKEGESYKEISRRLDCKTEYIRNLLHDSAGITVPLRRNGAVPRNHFNHNKGPAPQPPTYRRKNPPTELVIPCEFCGVPVPHEDLIEHETGCRPDLARFNPRRRSPEPDDYFIAPQPTSPEVELPCEFCGDMIPASQLLGHQVRCT
ncbi:TRAF-type zinc finger domain-containing protein 1 isoform X2 [Anoplophora glabripennis]|nr:TRAF-type zinc finger domain-containing protein 1 isoform X2 [Anoplophora glabripennis]